MAKRNFTYIDLFAGIGGFHLGLQRHGGTCLAFSEIDKEAIRAYCANHELESYDNLGDIRTIHNLPEHDILTAGVPCQSWSIAGKNLGFKDDRGQLWNDTIYLLDKTRPKAFIFENVKGLADPRNKEALSYILRRIDKAGYYAKPLILNSYDYGIVQNRIRVYIVGFRSKEHFQRFSNPPTVKNDLKLFDVLEGLPVENQMKRKFDSKKLFGNAIPGGRTRFQKIDEVNDFFLFNDIRNGHSTIHTWDLIETSEEEKFICYQILKNRRKKKYGSRDGNPLNYSHIKELYPALKKSTLRSLVNKGILKEVVFQYAINEERISHLDKKEEIILNENIDNILNVDQLAVKAKVFASNGFKYARVLNSLNAKKILKPIEVRYEFKNSKISSGINGINRIYMPNSNCYSTLVASDTNDYVATEYVNFKSVDDYKEEFIKQIYLKGKFRKITKEEACKIQGFPADFVLNEARNKWMKLLGNSVSVPVIEHLITSIIKTGVFDS